MRYEGWTEDDPEAQYRSSGTNPGEKLFDVRGTRNGLTHVSSADWRQKGGMTYVGPKKGWYVARSIVEGGADGHLQPEDEEVIYVIHAPEVGKVKIGRTKNIRTRMTGMQTDSPAMLHLLTTFTTDSEHSEGSLHRRFAKYRVRGEWFSDEILPELLAL